MLFTKRKKKTQLEKEIESVIKNLQYMHPNSEDYTTAVDNLKKLHDIKNEEKTYRVKADTLVWAGVSLAQIVMILGKERFDIITSKAMNFVIRGRV